MNESPTPDSPLDRLLDALRSAPTAHELTGEAAAVEAMTSAIAESPRGVTAVTARKPISKPLRRIVGLTAIGVLGVGGLAAAAKGVFVPDNRPAASHSDATDDETTEAESTVSETSIVDTTAVDTTAVDTTAVPGTDDESSDSTEASDSTAPGDTGPTTSIECADGNHGKTVSSVAHSVPPGPDHGEAVSAAAQSDCGKSDSTSSTSVDTTMPSDSTVAGTAPTNSNGQDNKPADPGSQGRGHKPSDPGAGHGPGTTDGS